jgi:hypothetical protein
VFRTTDMNECVPSGQLAAHYSHNHYNHSYGNHTGFILPFHRTVCSMPSMSADMNLVAICSNSLNTQRCPRYLNTLESITYNPLRELTTLSILPCTNPNPNPPSHACRSIRPSLPSISCSSSAGVSLPCRAIAKPVRLPCAD